MTMRLNPFTTASLLTTLLLLFLAPLTLARPQAPHHFAEAAIFLELNDTDGDLGIHASIDGGPWTDLEIEGPGEARLLEISSRGRLRKQGLVQLSLESDEPSFDELDPADFFRRFPEGRYEIEGRAPDGSTIESTAVLSHVLAAPPENILISGSPAVESCDSNRLPSVTVPVIIRWDPVTRSHPDIGKPGPVSVSQYQLFVEREGLEFGLDLPPAVTEVELPLVVTESGKTFKLEIIVRTTAGNNTAVESCFRVR